ncbi:MAG: PEP-CTERM sorting domain-containing protein [Phycisphaeraceae bacterium]
MHRPIRPLAAALVLALAASAGHARDGKTIYFLGNSMTDNVEYSDLDHMAEAAGQVDHAWGRHVMAGAPLAWLWDLPDNGWNHNQQGDDHNLVPALSEYTWDAVSIQPFEHTLPDEWYYVHRFANLAVSNGLNRDTQIYVYAAWPLAGPHNGAPDPTRDYQALWDRPYTDDWQRTKTRDFYYRLTELLNDPGATTDGFGNPLELSTGDDTLATADQPIADILNKPVRMFPIGDVLYELDKRLKADPDALEKYGVDDAIDLYLDFIHLNELGEFVAGTTVYATLYKESPVGVDPARYNDLTEDWDFEDLDPDYVALVQQTAWDVVAGHPHTGVVPEPATAGLLILGSALLLTRRR